MLLSDDQKQWLLDFIKDPYNSDRNKITFIMHYFSSMGKLHEFADHVGEHYGFAVPYEETEKWLKTLKEENAQTDEKTKVEQEEG